MDILLEGVQAGAMMAKLEILPGEGRDEALKGILDGFRGEALEEVTRRNRDIFPEGGQTVK